MLIYNYCCENVAPVKGVSQYMFVYVSCRDCYVVLGISMSWAFLV